MPDIATMVVSDGQYLSFDWAMCATDLESDAGLKTAVIISLFTDRLAAADDVLPDGGGDRRGWWGDLPLDNPGDVVQPDLIGSRLWLLERAKATPQTAAAAQNYATEALGWMLADGVAQSVKVTTSWISRDQLALYVFISRIGKNGAPVNHEYDFVWNPTLAGLPNQNCAVAGPIVPPNLLTESGQQIMTEGGQPLL